ncbi:MAG: glycoside hydrolase [Gemmatimonadales bacterium]
MARSRIPLCLLAASLAGVSAVSAQSVDPALFGGLAWRNIGPLRGGRTKSAVGIPNRPNIFYIGVVNGGVWKTTDYGHTWHPIFDDQPTGSIGAIAIAPSNPDIIYVGSGEGLQRPDLSTGDGIYKSTDGGATWRHLGLRDGQQIPQIVVDPRDPNRLFVAVLGHPYGPNEERGLFLSTDGGESFRKVLYRDENTGAIDVVLDPTNPDVIYAALWEARQGPWENGQFSGPGTGLFKSTDGGTTWHQLTNGLPTFEQDGLGRIGLTVAPSDPNRLYLTADLSSGGFLYRSDDAGASWFRVSEDPRIVSRASDFAEVKVHPTNPDIVFTASIVVWKSTDGGRNFTALKGAPGGDDYHRIWINPLNPEVILIAADQGAIVTVNGGQTWSSWYNQSTAQFYHVSTDNAFPYRVCGGQQESGSACVASRGNNGQITFREWHPVGVEEYGYVAADPLDPDLVYGGKVTRYDRRTGQVQNVAPQLFRSADYRAVRTAPVLFSPVNPKALYFATNTVWRTVSGGQSWTRISPDLTRTDSLLPASVGKYRDEATARARHPGVVYTVAPSYRRENVIWAGSDDGLIHITMNGGRTWRNVTPPGLEPWSKISLIDAGRFDTLTAYAAVNTLRIDDLRPHIYRTHDGGRSWTHITNGIPDGGIINAVREDPKRRGLLYAGSEQTVYVSFDDGDHWQSLRLNLPATSIRDLVIKDDDLVLGTHGRGFWILDDLVRLRELRPAMTAEPVVLFTPQTATRVRWNLNTDTPLPPEEPASPNPPDGAVIEYWLAGRASGVVTLEILDAAGRTIRTYRSDEVAPPITDEGNVPKYWQRPVSILSADAGAHRFLWDLKHEPPAGFSRSFPIAAVVGQTERDPDGVWVLPGRYQARLTVGGRSVTKSFSVRMDPRVKTPAIGLRQQFTLSRRIDSAAAALAAADREVRAARERLKGGDAALDQQLGRLLGGGGGFGRPAGPPSLAGVRGQLQQLFDALQEADVAPTTQLMAAVTDRLAALDGLLREWRRLRTDPRLR